MKIKANGITLECDVAGPEGAPWVTLSHSLGCDRTMWRNEVAAFADGYRVLAYDTRGHGGSEAPPAPYAFDDLIADAVGLWDALGIEKSHWVGLSLGGMTALGLALAHPDRVLSISVCDARADTDANANAAWESRIAAAREGGVEAVVEGSLLRWFTEASRKAETPAVAHAREMLRRTAVEGYAGCGQAIMGLAYLPRLGEIGVPAQFVVGAEDPATPPEASRAMQMRVRGARYVEIAKAAHLSNLENPEAFSAAIRTFLDGLR